MGSGVFDRQGVARNGERLLRPYWSHFGEMMLLHWEMGLLESLWGTWQMSGAGSGVHNPYPNDIIAELLAPFERLERIGALRNLR